MDLHAAYFEYLKISFVPLTPGRTHLAIIVSVVSHLEGDHHLGTHIIILKDLFVDDVHHLLSNLNCCLSANGG
jgi:hypothetical protein